MSAAPGVEKLILGDEYDDELREAVLDVLREMGARQTSQSSAVGGSQDLQTLSLKVGESELVVEAETYVGFSISGNSSLVHEVAARVRQRRPQVGSRAGTSRTVGDD